MTSTRKSAGIVGLAVVGSRVFGLVRELVFAAMFGAGKFLDSFLAAFQIPNLMRDLFAEGALSVAFTTTFTKTHETEGADSAWGLLSLLVSSVILILGGVCLLGIAASPLLVQLTSFGFHAVPGKFELTVQLTRVLFPFILFVSLAAVIMGALNARRLFGLPASASTVFNIVSVVLGVGLAYLFDPQPDWRHPHFGPRALWGVSLGVLLGGVAQMAIQVPLLWRLGYRFRWRLDFKDEKLRRVWRLMWPSVIAGAAVQINVLVNGMFASEINGARSWLNCAFRLMQFPLGVFGVAIATVTLPAVARHHAQSDLGAFGSTANNSLRLTVFLTVPAAVGLFVLAEPIIRLIYQHGRFSAADTLATALALRAYAVGLTGYAAIKVLAPCFYALDRPRLPLRVSLLGIGINMALNFLMVKGLGWGHVGLATTTATLAFVNGAQLFFYLRRLVHLGGAGWLGFLGGVAGAAVAGGGSAVAVHRYLQAVLPAGLAGELLALGAAMSAAVLVYFTITLVLRLPESAALWRVILRGPWRLVRGKLFRPSASEGPTKPES
ncbi:MAG: murein biosynthesis integral membrane protein MurJ [Verrucomicrobia bacterium]|nr:murein biosynthesis integral membrane protein MurJ [Verrucomicrobiota bacterium]